MAQLSAWEYKYFSKMTGHLALAAFLKRAYKNNIANGPG
jgi:hypothetical protein